MILSDKNNIANSPTNNSNLSATPKEIGKGNTFYQDSPFLREGLRGFAQRVAIQYGLDYDKFNYTIQNESGYNPDPPGNFLSRGVSQFTLPTWIQYCGKKDERLNPYKSIDCMGRMWKYGLQWRWDAYCFHYYDYNCVLKRNLRPKSFY